MLHFSTAVMEQWNCTIQKWLSLSFHSVLHHFFVLQNKQPTIFVLRTVFQINNFLPLHKVFSTQIKNCYINYVKQTLPKYTICIESLDRKAEGPLVNKIWIPRSLKCISFCLVRHLVSLNWNQYGNTDFNKIIQGIKLLSFIMAWDKWVHFVIFYSIERCPISMD